MSTTEAKFTDAEQRMQALRERGYAVAARYDRRASRVVIRLNSGLHVSAPTHLIEGLAGAPDLALSQIEISTSGLGLHWPQLDADVYVPGLLQGVFGSPGWMAERFGTNGAKEGFRGDSRRKAREHPNAA